MGSRDEDRAIGDSCDLGKKSGRVKRPKRQKLFAIIENEKSLRFPWTIVQRNVDKMEDVTRMSV